jgi:hypothetical protein
MLILVMFYYFSRLSFPSCVTGGSQAAAITPGSAGSSNSAVSANPANPSVVATQGTDASGSTVSGSTGTTRVAGAGVGATTAYAYFYPVYYLWRLKLL